MFPFGPIYDATLDLYFPSKWEFGWLTNTVVLAHDSSLTWISDEFTYNGETCIATLVITGVGSGQATLTIETTSIYLGNVVYKNEASPFENLGPNRMVVHGSSTWTPATGAYIACLYPYETYIDCLFCNEADLSGFVVESAFGTQIYRLDDMLPNDDPDLGDCEAYPDATVTWFQNPPGEGDACSYLRYFCSGGVLQYYQQVELSSVYDYRSLVVREVDYTVGPPDVRHYRKNFSVDVDCHDDETVHTLTRFFGSTGSTTVTWQFTRV